MTKIVPKKCFFVKILSKILIPGPMNPKRNKKGKIVHMRDDFVQDADVVEQAAGVVRHFFKFFASKSTKLGIETRFRLNLRTIFVKNQKYRCAKISTIEWVAPTKRCTRSSKMPWQLSRRYKMSHKFYRGVFATCRSNKTISKTHDSASFNCNLNFNHHIIFFQLQVSM